LARAVCPRGLPARFAWFTDTHRIRRLQMLSRLDAASRQLDGRSPYSGRPSAALTRQEPKPSLPPLIGVSLVVPMLNEEANVDALVRSVAPVLTTLAAEWELILVNDGSSDGTGNRIRDAERRDSRIRQVTHETRRGYGAALRSGMSAARHAYVAL